MNILDYVLTAPLARGPYRDLAKWLRAGDRCPFSGHVERAIWAGFHADRLGFAFAGGYGAALAQLVASRAQLVSARSQPAPPLRGITSLAATEAGGGHPRAIATRLDKEGGALVLRGEKTFATLGTIADELLVVASRGVEADGKNRLRVARVKPGAAGVSIEPGLETPFAPEIPHAIVRLRDVVVEPADVLPGDGFTDWLKPFRTIEDVHVLAATMGYLTGAARAYGFRREVTAELASLALSLVDLGARDDSAPLTHVLLAGTFASSRRLLGALDEDWARADPKERDRFVRDRPLLFVADGARAKRAESAWKSLTSASR